MNTQDRIRKLMAEWYGMNESDITPEKELERDLNLDSLDMIEIAMHCEDEFAVELLDDDLEKIKTVGEFYALVEKSLAGAPA